MKKIYQKLVRDNIPDIISMQGKSPGITVLSEEEYKRCLHEKLAEEVNEYLEDDNIGEICDIFEVMYAILESKNISFDEMEKARMKKVKMNGAFRKRIFLEAVEDNL